MTAISVIIGSTRQGRFSERPAEWILKHLKKRSGVDARLLDLRDYPMPFFDQPVSPATPGRLPYVMAAAVHQFAWGQRARRGCGPRGTCP